MDTQKENGNNKLKNRDKNSWREEEKGRERHAEKVLKKARQTHIAGRKRKK